MEFQNMKVQINKNKSIGKVLYIVEGSKKEPQVLYQIFCKILDYQMETILRGKDYEKYNSKVNPTSQVFVINAEESNIKDIEIDNEFLNNLFKVLIEEYDFDVDNSAIYYLFDRDRLSNTDESFVKDLISVLKNSRDNGTDRQGLLLLSYPSIESFVLSNFENNCFDKGFKTGRKLKQELHNLGISHQRISEETLIHATGELFRSLYVMSINEIDIDAFDKCNMDVFEFQEDNYKQTELYQVLSLISISLIDLGIVELNN